MQKARRTTLEVTYAGVNISKDITTDLVSFSFTDNESSKADDLDITILDREGKWSREWFPTLGDKITASLVYEDGEQLSVLNCGSFQLDQFDNSSSSSGTTVSFKAVSIPQANTVRRTQKNRAWEGVKLSEIAADVSKTGALELTYATDINPVFERIEQNNKSDLAFLQGLCENIALSIKITNDQIVIFNRDDLEVKAPISTLVWGDQDIISWAFSTQIHDTYSESKIEYKDPKTGKKTTSSVKDEKNPNGKVLKQTKRVESQADADRQAKAHLKNKNRKKTTGNITIMGDVRYKAGSVVEIIGFGKWDGKYYVDTATHGISGGYTVSLELSSINNPKDDEKKKDTKKEKEKKVTKKKAERKKAPKKAKKPEVTAKFDAKDQTWKV